MILLSSVESVSQVFLPQEGGNIADNNLR